MDAHESHILVVSLAAIDAKVWDHHEIVFAHSFYLVGVDWIVDDCDNQIEDFSEEPEVN